MRAYILLLTMTASLAWGQATQPPPGKGLPAYLHWAGNWSSTVTYNQQDVVDYNNAAWISMVTPNTGIPPASNTLFWTAWPGAAGAVASVFGRTGAVIAASSSPFDYQFSQIGGVAAAAQIPALTGDVAGALNSTIVQGLRGNAISTTAPANGQTLVFNSGTWAPAAAAGGVQTVFGRAPDGSGNIAAANGDYSFSLISGTVGSAQLPAAGGDLSGASLATPTVAKIQGRAVATTAPTDGQGLVWSAASSAWTPGAAGAVKTVFGRAPDGSGNIAAANGDYSFSLISGTVGSAQLPAAGGDLSGASLATPTVAKIQGQPISTTAPALSQSLVWSGTAWTPTSVATGGTATPFPGQVGNTDFLMTVSGATLTVSNGAFQFASLDRVIGNDCVFTLASTTPGAADVYYTDGGQLTINYSNGGTANTVTVTSGNNCQAVGSSSPSFPAAANYKKVGVVPILAGNAWGAAIQSPSLSNGYFTACSPVFVCTLVGATITIDAGPMLLQNAVANTMQPAGSWDASAAQFSLPGVRGTGTPASAACTTARVGSLYVQSDAAAGHGIWWCTPGGGVPTWRETQFQ
jgi:hypothetical protein